MAKYDFVNDGTCQVGKNFGTKVEQIIRNLRLYEKSSDISHDFKTSLGEKIEVKAIRPGYTKGSSFQQIKPCCCDYFIFAVCSPDNISLYKVPSHWIKPRKYKGERASENILLMGRQHRNNWQEGKEEGAISWTKDTEKFLNTYCEKAVI